LRLERAECQGAPVDESRKFSAPLSNKVVMLSKAKHLCSIFLGKMDPKTDPRFFASLRMTLWKELAVL
jgi:hypothetical protein